MNRSLIFLLAASAALTLDAQGPAPKAKAEAPKPPTVPPPAPAPKVLKVGDPAPVFKVGRWVKHGPIAELKKGHIYVVEFWATWCPPCKDSIPHLTELAKKLEGKVTIIGVDVWERPKPGEDIDATVDAFVKEFGAKMDYHVVRDSADQHMTNAWMKAAQQRGIPAAFIIDKTGTIAYIGNPHPSNKAFDQALEQIVAGTWDVKAALAKAEQEAAEAKAEDAKAQARQKAAQEVMPAIQDAAKAKDWAKVLQLSDAAEAKYPDLKSLLKRPRFYALAATDRPKAKAMMDADLEKPDMPALMNAATLMVSPEVDKSWAPQALECIEKAIALEPRVEPQALRYKLTALLRTDDAKAKAFFEAEKAKGAMKAAPLAQAVVAEEGLAPAWNEAAAGLLEEALKDPKASPRLREPLAEAQFRCGKAKDAVATMETFLTWAKGAGAPPPMVQEFEATLKKYQAAAK